MEGVKIWEEQVIIPTYEIGQADKNPIFLDKRVYQGSSGRIYPYPTVEKISDEKRDKAYQAVFLENEYIRVMILPELGGRIQRAYDKTNGYDFVYYNHVIKPALVGLTGPWISGGIEFNWPQHHRPTTFMPVDYQLVEHEDGSRTLMVNDVDQMYGTKGIASFTLYPGKAYIEIRGQLYNRTPMDQTFLWWANPAVPVNDYTQSIFPPDVHAVMDHGKRDVSRFPIATGVYYKHDYSEGVDISRYKNIPVPTSYMAEKSKYDFVGGYDYRQRAGILHVADHHVSPGKKQWTWGCGDFGKAWDRNLTDEDGPYIELMTGVYTDNQPDFTWLKPFEEKTFKQYFMPYKAVGPVKNATIRGAVNLEVREEGVYVCVYATERCQGAAVRLIYDGVVVYEEETLLSPVDIYEKTIGVTVEDETKLRVEAVCGERTIVAYQPEKQEIERVPEPAKAAEDPDKIMTNEELYLTGQHIEQYRHATYLPDPYYLEGLKRDPGDMRINDAYGLLLMRRGLFGRAEEHFRRAIGRAVWKNPNPYNSQPYYDLGLSLWYQGRDDEAFDAFYKASWSNEQQEMSFYYLAAIEARRGNFEAALELAEKGLVKNAHNVKARGLKAYILRRLGKRDEALQWIAENRKVDGFDYVSMFEEARLAEEDGDEAQLGEKVETEARLAEKNGVEARSGEEYGDEARPGEEVETEAQLTEKNGGEARPAVKAGAETQSAGTGAVEKSVECPSWGVPAGVRARSRTEVLEEMNRLMRGFSENYLQAARDFAEFGAYEEAEEMLGQCVKDKPMLFYYRAYFAQRRGLAAEAVAALLERAEGACPDYCFPNKLEDIRVLESAIERNPGGARAYYYLGNLFYDKLQYKRATELWEKSAGLDGSFPVVLRNLALSYYNKMGRKDEAREMMERAFALDASDARIFLELDQLYKKLGVSAEERLARYEANRETFMRRDDAVVEYITLKNQLGRYREAYDLAVSRRFHPWEGGEGKITTQYTVALVELAKEAIGAGEYERAEELLSRALVYPESLGEGKLEGTKDNHIYYYLGCVKEALGCPEEARECFERASVGPDEPAGMMYYYDQPADMILYQGLAKLKLGKTGEAKSRFYRLIDYGEQHIGDHMRIEYFAVSLPDFLIFEDDLDVKNRAHCCYLICLGNLGLGKVKEAEAFFDQALEMDGNHLNAIRYRKGI